MNSKLVFLVALSRFCVESFHIQSWSSYSASQQIFSPWYPDYDDTPPVEIELKSESGQTSYTVKCKEYSEEDPRADVYTKNGIHLETLILDHLADDPCDPGKLRNYVVPEDPTEQEEYSISYLWSDKRVKCARREYQYHTRHLVADIFKSDTFRVSCPERVTKFYNLFTNGKKAGGVVALAPTGNISQLGFEGKTATAEFPAKDLKGKSFYLRCRENLLKWEYSPDVFYSNKVGFLVHEDHPKVFLDKFEMSSCKTTHINVNRKIVDGNDEYKVVFKSKGNCYERSYQVYGQKTSFYFHSATVHRMNAVKVSCPTRFIDDIGLNARRPWYKILFWFLFGNPERYAIETETKKKTLPYISGDIDGEVAK